MQRSVALNLAASLALLAGCSSPAPPTSTPVAASPTGVAEDVTAQVKDTVDAEFAALVTKAERDGESLRIETSITDPRGDHGSPEAQQAISICEAVVSALEPTYLRVNEADGTAFVIFQGREFMDIPANTCGEV